MRMRLFTALIDAFDRGVVATLTHGSAAVISLITPVLMTCFSIYLLLLCLSYWNSGSAIPVGDTIKKVMAWAAIITFGLNVETYTTYVVPFFNGFGDDVARALTGEADGSRAMVLDTLFGTYVDAVVDVWEALPSNPLVAITAAIQAMLLSVVIIVGGTLFLGIAAAYIIMAHFALALLLALGPLFFACALFPATRKFFDAWVGQCLNYGLLTVLFAAVATLQVRFAVDAMPGSGSELARSIYGDAVVVDGFIGLAAVIAMAAIFAVFIVISTNLPGLASQLAGGMGISGLVGGSVGSAIGGAAKSAAKKLSRKAKGGSMSPESSGG